MDTIVEKICDSFPLTENEAKLLIFTAPSRYKVHYIEKRHGRGKRLIAQPSAEIKVLQRWALENYVNKLPIHSAATAYRKGISIKSHADKHAKNKYLLKLDFRDFFPSIKASDFIEHVKKHADMSDLDANYLSRILFRAESQSELVLSIGAPSSPTVSNTIMFEFDSLLARYSSANKISYSRYADDLALSTNEPKVLDVALEFVKSISAKIAYPRLSLNNEKTVFTSMKHQRRLTGLILTNDGEVSLGRDKKRLIRAMAHKFSLDELPSDDVGKLRGLLAFAYSIDPSYILKIRELIGDDKFLYLMKSAPEA